MKTITISDDVYEKLARLKGKRSFSETIDDLIRKNVEKRIEMLIASAEKTGNEKELERIYKEIRKEFKVRL
ncbi:MAG: antitoxin VapB family protein [Archaeoglobaceae archaeon]|nr:antitoxin VapB family protein [Archaeoglobaceae archaeon]MDW7990291.1 antitoxin VapB family protein [Archaeoglobaceae archaeon]